MEQDRTKAIRAIISIIVAIIVLALLAWLLFIRDTSDTKNTGQLIGENTAQQAKKESDANGQKSDKPAASDQNTTPATAGNNQENSRQLADTGPGPAVLIFAFSAAVAGIAHYAYLQHRQTLVRNT